MKRLTNSRRWRILTAAGAVLTLSGAVGCTTGLDEFRTVATPALQAGVSQIMNGVLDGFFAAIEPEPSSTTNGTTTTNG